MPYTDYEKLFKGTSTKPVGFAKAAENKFTTPQVKPINPMEFYKQTQLGLHGGGDGVARQGVLKGFSTLKVPDVKPPWYSGLSTTAIRALGIYGVAADVVDAVGDNVTNEQMNAGAEAYPWWLEEWLMNKIGVGQ
jgi:hypothetical protein